MLLGHITAFIADYILHGNSRLAYTIIRLFELNYEHNLPTWFSTLILAFAATLLLLIHSKKKTDGAKGAVYWLVLGLIFIFLSIDESVQLHEEFADFLRPRLGNDVSGFFFWAWVIPYAIFVIILIVFFSRFVLGLPAKTRNLFFISGGMFVCGALGLEFIEGYFFKLYGLNHIYNRILYTIEELLEMTAISLFIYALLDYISANKIKISATS